MDSVELAGYDRLVLTVDAFQLSQEIVFGVKSDVGRDHHQFGVFIFGKMLRLISQRQGMQFLFQQSIRQVFRQQTMSRT